MKTLLATDGSHEATTALLTATRLLRQRDNEVHILCVAPEFYEPRGRKNGARAREEYQKRIVRETQTILDRAQKTLLAEGDGRRTEYERIKRLETSKAALGLMNPAEDA